RPAALAAGLAYAYLPVQGGYQSPEEIARCAELLKTLPRPLLMFCRSGARSSRLYMQAAALDQ
ncbi:MAG: TIGR01244 family phosphatase, partial [Aquabacterium sp.]|uniref:beta-lactamase hydrolase domain-containing protein n=1 Tax=Aquabacterium sp. TaxID=1872578 RepID=UPI0011FC8A62